MGWVLDLDGVIWLGDVPIPGAADAVARLRAAGEAVVFCTNNSSEPVGPMRGQARSPRHSGRWCRRRVGRGGGHLGERRASGCSCVAARGSSRPSTAVGAPVVLDGPVDVVIVGFDRGFDYERLRIASAAVRAGPDSWGRTTTPRIPPPRGSCRAVGRIAGRCRDGERGATPWWPGSPTGRWPLCSAHDSGPGG